MLSNMAHKCYKSSPHLSRWWANRIHSQAPYELSFACQDGHQVQTNDKTAGPNQSHDPICISLLRGHCTTFIDRGHPIYNSITLKLISAQDADGEKIKATKKLISAKSYVFELLIKRKSLIPILYMLQVN